MARKYIAYKAHELRKGVVHASDDELVVLLGDLALEPGKKAKYILEFPSALKSEPTLDIRFILKEEFDKFIGDCQDGELPFPADFASYSAPDLITKRKTEKVAVTDDRPPLLKHRLEQIQEIDTGEATSVEMVRVLIEFTTDPKEGAYLFVVNTKTLVPEASDSFSVVVYNKTKTFFPESEDDDLAELLGHSVNLSVKNGLIWFIHPIFFVEQFTNTELSTEVKKEMVNCEGLPQDLPASDSVLVKLIWGYWFRGLKKIRLYADRDEDVCVKTDPVQVRKNDFEFSEFIKKVK